MMESLHIKNFKNFKELTIEKLGKVNLIVGKNNVGKSSLLEAISIYITNGEENWLRELLADRGEAIRDDIDEVNAEDFEAVAVYSKLDFTGVFTCSNEKINNTLKEKHLTSLLERMAEDYASRDEYNFTYDRASAWYTKEKHFDCWGLRGSGDEGLPRDYFVHTHEVA